jgi:phosphonate transport system ATP-binding protein
LRRKQEISVSSPPNNSADPYSALILEEVSVSFGAVRALSSVSLEVSRGERVAIVGSSGAGKSTLFRVLTRSVPLEGGRIVAGDGDMYRLPRRGLRRVRRQVGTIYQAYNLIPQLPAGVNAALGEIGDLGVWGTVRTLTVGPPSGLSKKVAAALERVGLEDYAHARTADLSGGQQQRVAVARLLVQRPELILADEPVAAVDPVTAERVIDSLFELNEEGSTLLMNLHNVELVRRFPRVIALRRGRVFFDGSPERLTGEMLEKIYSGEERDDLSNF